jgi:hypothetical protein
MSPLQGAINYGREDKQFASAHEGPIATSCIEKEVRFGSIASVRPAAAHFRSNAGNGHPADPWHVSNVPKAKLATKVLIAQRSAQKAGRESMIDTLVDMLNKHGFRPLYVSFKSTFEQRLMLLYR